MRSTLELIEPGSWRTVDGYEFKQYETITCVKSVRLETRSRAAGYGDFIAVGTIVHRGEDLAAKGSVSRRFSITLSPVRVLSRGRLSQTHSCPPQHAPQVYIFEVVDGEPAKDELNPRRTLRLLTCEELKAPVGAVYALNGYLLHSVGLKVRQSCISGNTARSVQTL